MKFVKFGTFVRVKDYWIINKKSKKSKKNNKKTKRKMTRKDELGLNDE